jgi:diaminohydroxyphosphoribosylaminopyrimidine deaminase/5-amino-6-(5-phosphoribosylamino)uracil reductase
MSATDLRSDDLRLMDAALALSRRHLGAVAPNPAVGALVVKDGIVVGAGATQPGGRPHAETEALAQAGEAAKGATLYVTLEPCSHHGRTPPCADAIVSAGIARVVSAIEDPDSRVAGRGHALLRAAGIDVNVGLRAAEAREINIGHILRVTTGRPTITLKLAMTADGFAAGTAHDPRLAITGAIANTFVHMQRALHDAIMVGSGTVLTDDPLMTVRLPGVDRRPVRVVLDSNLAVSPHSRLVQTAGAYPTLIVAGADAPADRRAALAEAGIEILTVPRDRFARIDLGAALLALGKRGITRVFSEGGPTVAGALIAAGLADEVLLLRASKPLGFDGTPALEPAARGTLDDPALYRADAPRLVGVDTLARYRRIG